MSENNFHFKQFDLLQNKSAMKVGTDGVLLGAWCDVENIVHVLDIGTGTGLISLMIAQRDKKALITAVEIDADAASEAQCNFTSSKWAERLNVINCNFMNFNSDERFDLIISNPPFFLAGSSSENKIRAVARHSDNLPFDKLFKKVYHLLNERGIFAMITPDAIKSEIEFIALDADLWLKRQTFVHTKENRPPKRILCEFVKYPVQTEYSHLNIMNVDNKFSEEYKILTSDFYLDF